VTFVTSHELEIASYIKRTRIALVLLGILYAWTAYGNYDHLRPWVDGSMFANEPMGEIKLFISHAYFMILVTGIASGANLVLAAIAGKRTTLAIYTAMGIFAVYTALRLYQTSGRSLSSWLWWVTAIVLGVGFQAAYKASQLRASTQLAKARSLS
jgi:fucose 4-O-acetylase-like acetyltransferase